MQRQWRITTNDRSGIILFHFFLLRPMDMFCRIAWRWRCYCALPFCQHWPLLMHVSRILYSTIKPNLCFVELKHINGYDQVLCWTYLWSNMILATILLCMQYVSQVETSWMSSDKSNIYTYIVTMKAFDVTDKLDMYSRWRWYKNCAWRNNINSQTTVPIMWNE